MKNENVSRKLKKFRKRFLFFFIPSFNQSLLSPDQDMTFKDF